MEVGSGDQRRRSARTGMEAGSGCTAAVASPLARLLRASDSAATADPERGTAPRRRDHGRGTGVSEERERGNGASWPWTSDGMPRRGKAKQLSYRRPAQSPYALKPLPEGVPVPMCFCGNPCKVDISEEEETYRQRYWMCPNFAWEPTEQQRRTDVLTPPPTCDFEQWIDTEIKQSDKEHLEWLEEHRQRYEMRMKQEAAEKEHKEEEERRKAAAIREEKDRKRERARRAKVAMEENPDALKKGKWSRCTQYIFG